MKDMLNNKATILPEPGEEEIWRDLSDLGFPRYQVSSFGRVKGVKGEILHPATDKNGYLCCWLYKIENKISKRKYVKIHRIVCQVFNGDPDEEKNMTDHIDRCRINNYYKNLRWVDKKENAKNTDRSNTPRYGGKTGLPIWLYNKEGKRSLRFENVKEASEFFGISEHQIRANLAGQRTPFRIGYFKFEEDIVEEKLDN